MRTWRRSRRVWCDRRAQSVTPRRRSRPAQSVIPAKAGSSNPSPRSHADRGYWMPAFAGMTADVFSGKETGFLSRDRAMEKFTVLEGVAAPLKMINVDTDAIIPKNYLKTIKRTGLGKG